MLCHGEKKRRAPLVLGYACAVGAPCDGGLFLSPFASLNLRVPVFVCVSALLFVFLAIAGRRSPRLSSLTVLCEASAAPNILRPSPSSRSYSCCFCCSCFCPSYSSTSSPGSRAGGDLALLPSSSSSSSLDRAQLPARGQLYGRPLSLRDGGKVPEDRGRMPTPSGPQPFSASSSPSSTLLLSPAADALERGKGNLSVDSPLFLTDLPSGRIIGHRKGRSLGGLKELTVEGVSSISVLELINEVGGTRLSLLAFRCLSCGQRKRENGA